jgi:dienelactone hydrolase
MIQKKFTLKHSTQDKGTMVVCNGVNEKGEELQFQVNSTDDELFIKIGYEIEKHASVTKFYSEMPILIECGLLTEEKIPVLFCYQEGTSQLPIVFFNHGNGQDAVDYISMGIALAQAGFFAVLMDARMHGRRRMPDFNERFLGKDYKKLYLEMLLGTSSDISSLIDYLQDDSRVNTQRVGISGISQGGYVSFFAITQDKRINAAAPIIGSPDLEGQFGYSLPFDELEETLQQDIIKYSPLRNYTQIPPVALLVQNGNDDQIVPVEGVRKLNAALIKLYNDMPERYHYLEYDGVGHTESVTGNENPLVMRHMAMDWFKRFL